MKEPKPKVSFSPKDLDMYMFGTTSNLGEMNPLYPSLGTMVPGGVDDGKKRKSPWTNSPSICIRNPGWKAIPAGL